MAYAPALTPHAALTTADGPSPRVDVKFASLASSTATIDLYALTTEGTYKVLGGDGGYAVGGFAVTDYEVPLGVPVTYRGEMFDSSGTSLGFTDSSITQVNTDPGQVWFTDPLVPASAVQAIGLDTFGKTKTRKREGSTFRVGSRTVALFSPLGLLEGIDLSVETFDVGKANALVALMQASPVLVRSMPPVRVPRSLYAVIAEATETDVNVDWGGNWTTQPLQGDQVSRSTVDIVVPVTTWQDYMNVYSTWASFESAYLTWLDAETNPPAH